jgi:lipopolysaccharide export system protein LptA
MYIRIFFCTSIAILFIATAMPCHAQTGVADTTGKKLEIIEALRYNYQNLQGAGTFVSVGGNVRIRQGTTLFYCDSAVLNHAANTVEAFGNIHINDEDSVHTYSQYLKYLGHEKKAILKNKVRLTDGRAVLTTNELEYNTLTKIGTYLKGGKVVDGKTVLTSTEGYYYGETRDMYFKRKVFLNDPEYKVTTDTLLYNTYTQLARFVAPTKIVTDKRTIKTSEGYYDVQNKKALFGKRPTVDDKDYTLTADDMAFDNASGFGEAQGNVVYKNKDTANAFAMLANNIKTNSNTAGVLATQKPLMIIKQNRDSIYVTADTLYSGKLTELQKTRTIPDITDTILIAKNKVRNAADSNSNRFFEAYYHVKIFMDSLQSVSDSLFYSFKDSVFRLFKNPVVWAQENQIAGDTIYLYTQNKKPKRFYVFENALAINKVEKNLYNQVKGNTINGYFENGSVHFFKAKGNAENIYYASDDNGGFIGANRSTSDVIDVYFEDRKPNKVVLRNNLTGTISPMRGLNYNEFKVKGFKWLEDKRPKTKFDLFGQ